MWNNTNRIFSNFPQLKKIFEKLSYRPMNTLSDDINQIILLGKINYINLNENTTTNNNIIYASIGLTTRNTYMTSKGYSSTYAHHK
ncbi:unnamed protein product, partial [Schistosoma turkestanicum]